MHTILTFWELDEFLAELRVIKAAIIGSVLRRACRYTHGEVTTRVTLCACCHTATQVIRLRLNLGSCFGDGPDADKITKKRDAGFERLEEEARRLGLDARSGHLALPEESAREGGAA